MKALKDQALSFVVNAMIKKTNMGCQENRRTGLNALLVTGHTTSSEKTITHHPFITISSKRHASNAIQSNVGRSVFGHGGPPSRSSPIKNRILAWIMTRAIASGAIKERRLMERKSQ
jgi:hypothetical protein